jgi:hypothetical protein
MKIRRIQIAASSWLVNKVIDYKMDCDFKAMYGDAFSV